MNNTPEFKVNVNRLSDEKLTQKLEKLNKIQNIYSELENKYGVPLKSAEGERVKSQMSSRL